MSVKNLKLLAIWAVVIVAAGGLAYGLYTRAEPGELDANAPYAVHHLIWLVVLIGALVAARPSLSDVGKAIVGWGGLATILIAGYAYRMELQEVGNRTLGALIPGYAVESRPGASEIVLYRSSDGHFRAIGEVNGVSVTFLVDTGASSTTLTAADAERAGLNLSQLSFSIPVSTANGEAKAAYARLDSLSIGGVRRSGINAHVAERGRLNISLLGMSFLGSLKSYEVRGDRLILRP
jgi:aspartyl protease family protein